MFYISLSIIISKALGDVRGLRPLLYMAAGASLGVTLGFKLINFAADKWYTKVGLMLCSIVPCVSLGVFFGDALDQSSRGSVFSFIHIVMGTSLGVIIGIKLIK